MVSGGIRRRSKVKLYHESALNSCNLKISILIPTARHLPTNQDHNKAEIAKKIRICPEQSRINSDKLKSKKGINDQ